MNLRLYGQEGMEAEFSAKKLGLGALRFWTQSAPSRLHPGISMKRSNNLTSIADTTASNGAANSKLRHLEKCGAAQPRKRFAYRGGLTEDNPATLTHQQAVDYSHQAGWGRCESETSPPLTAIAAIPQLQQRHRYGIARQPTATRVAGFGMERDGPFS